MTPTPPDGETQGAAAADPIEVGLCIVGFRNPADIRTCLAAVAALAHRQFSVHVCENGGPAAFEALLAALVDRVDDPAVFDVPPGSGLDRVAACRRGTLRPGGQSVFLYQANDNLGFAGGINICLAGIAAATRWQAVWFLNPDAEPEPDALGALVAKAATGRYDVIGSRLLFSSTGRVQLYGGRWRRWIARGLNLGFNEPGDALPDVARIEAALDYVNGASLFATRDRVLRAGPLDERYFLYAEEVDWCFRRPPARLGYAHDSIVHHAHGSTIGSNRSRAGRSTLSVYLDERNKLLMTRRYFPWRFPIVAAITLVLTGQYLAAGAGRNFKVAVAGWWAGLCGRTGPPP